MEKGVEAICFYTFLIYGFLRCLRIQVAQGTEDRDKIIFPKKSGKSYSIIAKWNIRSFRGLTTSLLARKKKRLLWGLLGSLSHEAQDVLVQAWP